MEQQVEYPPSWDTVELPRSHHRNTQAEWQKARAEARIRRAALIKKLGGECVECGSDEELTFQHPHGRTWEPRKVNGRQRIRLYERDFEAGLLTLLCNGCNSHDGASKQKHYRQVKMGIIKGGATG